MQIKQGADGDISFLENNGNAITMPQVYKSNGKRTVVEKEHDLEFIAELYLKGFSQMDITEQLNEARVGHYELSRQQVRKDIQTIHKRWIETSVNMMEQRMIIECSKLDNVEHEMWNLYERSQQSRKITENTLISGQNTGSDEDKSGKVVKGKVVSSGVGAQKSKGFSRFKSITREESNIGDLEILKEIRITVMERSKLLGLVTTKSQVNINWRKEAEAAGIDPQEFVNTATERIIDSVLARGSIYGSLGEGEENSGSEEE